MSFCDDMWRTYWLHFTSVLWWFTNKQVFVNKKCVLNVGVRKSPGPQRSSLREHDETRNHRYYLRKFGQAMKSWQIMLQSEMKIMKSWQKTEWKYLVTRFANNAFQIRSSWTSGFWGQWHGKLPKSCKNVFRRVTNGSQEKSKKVTQKCLILERQKLEFKKIPLHIQQY